jgi:trimeric autotransporter adhesin
MYSMKHVRSLSFIFIALAMFAGYAFLVSAAAPSGGYTPGATLDPDCAPGDTDCIVQASGGGISGGTDGRVTLWSGPTSVTSESWFTYDSGDHEVSAWESISGLNVSFDSEGGPDDLTASGIYTAPEEIAVYIVGLAGDTQLEYTPLSGGFANNEELVGQTSGATANAVLFLEEFGENIVILNNVIGTFQSGETVVGQIGGGELTVTSSDILGADMYLWFDADDQAPAGFAEITGSIQSVYSGLEITFGSTTGHEYFDNWFISNATSAQGSFVSNSLKLKSGNGEIISISAPEGLGSYGIIMPDQQGTVGQSLINDGSGNLTWGKSLEGATGVVGLETWLGISAGSGGSTQDTTFVGYNAGYNATNANNSTFIGLESGNGASDAYDSVFIGKQAGLSALNSSGAVFIGGGAGSAASLAQNSTFVGSGAGYGSTSASNSTFLGSSAGINANDAFNSVFIGLAAGENAGTANASIFIGTYAGRNDTVNNSGGNSSILLGYDTSTGGYSDSIAIGTSAENTMSNQFLVAAAYNNWQIAGVDYVWPSSQGAADSVLVNDGSGGLSWGSGPVGLIGSTSSSASWETWLGAGAGSSGASQSYTVFVGIDAGQGAASAYNSNFIGYGAGGDATSAHDSNFMGAFAGLASQNAYNSNFFGPNAGREADNANNSNFFGTYTGYLADSANDSNFMGQYAGYQATDAIYSNFIGARAGYGAATAEYSNFFGYKAGEGALAADNSIFMGQYAGSSATNANDSVFMGHDSGLGATDASYSTFIGYQSGYQAESAYNSNFFGRGAGFVATNASNSNFFGAGAGDGAIDANNSNFFGQDAGSGATSAGSSNFLGYRAGYQATSAFNSNFMGTNAGYQAAGSEYSNFFGNNAGYGVTSVTNSNFFGQAAAYFAENASHSNFFGYRVGYNSVDVGNSNFFGYRAGYEATNAADSNFFGRDAGYTSSNASQSNFIGYLAGSLSDGASFANFIGSGAGYATAAVSSNFIGKDAGREATDSINSNFMGSNAGYQATNASDSNFIGTNTGSGSANASLSNFFGYAAGSEAVNAANSIFIGSYAGYNDTVNNSPGESSILIGNQTSTGGYSNSIALGAEATNTGSNQFMIGSFDSPINTLILTGASSQTCTLDVSVSSPSCTSDERLKTNINDLDSVLNDLNQVRTVTYNWKGNPDGNTVTGFLAQDLEQYFPSMVGTAPNGYKTVSYGGMTPVLVKAVQELDLKLSDIEKIADDGNSFGNILRNWFADAANGIQKIFVKEVQTDRLCVGSRCITEEQFNQLLDNQDWDDGNTGNEEHPGESLPEEETPADPEVSMDEPVVGDVPTEDPVIEVIPEEIPTPEVPVEPAPEPAPEAPVE